MLNDSLSTDTEITVVDREDTATGESTKLYYSIFLMSILFKGNVDYISGPYTVTVAAGETRARLHMQVKDDDIVEDEENFDLIIDNASLPRAISIGNPFQARVTIVDDDRE